jgi:hypothetical protein
MFSGNAKLKIFQLLQIISYYLSTMEVAICFSLSSVMKIPAMKYAFNDDT